MRDYRHIIFSVFSIALIGLVFSCAYPMLHMGMGDGFSSTCMPLATFISVDRPNLATLLFLLVAYIIIAIFAQKLITKNQSTGLLRPPNRYLLKLLDFNFNSSVSGFVLVRTTHRKVF